MKHLPLLILLLSVLVGCGKDANHSKSSKQELQISDTLLISGHFTHENIKTDTINIGDKFDLVFEAHKDIAEVIEFPQIKYDSMDIELVSERIDTLQTKARRQLIRKRYTYQAFTYGNMKVMPQMYYVNKNICDTIYASDTIVLHIANPVQLTDSSTLISALRPQLELPYKEPGIEQRSNWLAILGVVALLVLLLLVVLFFMNRSGKVFFSTTPLTADQVARRDLEHLHKQRLWQNQQHKLYYSSLTDILRRYISDRWGVSAMEMTSDEIWRSIQQLDIPQKTMMDIRDLLSEADLVKFAKATPDAAQNEQAFDLCWDFVEQTTPRQSEPETEEQA